MRRLGVAVLGAGRIGSVHCANLASSLKTSLVGVMDPDRERARECSLGTRVYRDLEEVLGDSAVQAVVVASATPHHAEQVEACARAGKAIFCEKPVSLSLDLAEAALDVVESCGVPFQIGFQRRYDRGFAAARERLAAGEVGALEFFRALSCDPAPAPMDYLAQSGGICRDMAVHDLDLACFFGGEVAQVRAEGATLVLPELASIGDVDTLTITLRFVSGAMGSILCRRRSGFGTDIRTELFGSKGKLVVEDEGALPVRLFRDNRGSWDCHDWFVDRFRQAYRDELAAFADAVLDGHPPEPGPSEARATMRVAEAAALSLTEGTWAHVIPRAR